MIRLQDLTIRRKLVAIIMFTSATALLLTGSAYTIHEQITLRSTEVQNLWSEAGIVGYNCRAALAFAESSDAEDTLSSLRARPSIAFACVYTTDGEVLARYQRDDSSETSEAPLCEPEGRRFENGQLLVFRRIVHNGEVMGTVHLRSTLDHLRAILKRNVAIVGMFLLASLAVASLMTARLQRVISKPILDLTEAARNISQNGDYTKCRVQHGRDELGTLIDSFNLMIDTIQESQARLMEENAERRRAEADLARHLDRVEEEVEKRTHELRRSNESLAKEVAERQQAEAELRTAQKRLVETAHRAGMADVATDVLHNVGNVLNSINVTTTRMADLVVHSKVSSLARVTALIDDHRHVLGAFLTEDERGRQIPTFLTEVSRRLGTEQSQLADMLEGLGKNVQHVKDTITMQQSYARVSGMEEQVSMSEIIENAIQINSAALERHNVRLVREYEEQPPIQVNKQKVLQILVNLLSNGKYALSHSTREDKVLTVRLQSDGGEAVRVDVIDNGVGIAPENLDRIFRHGFTTKKDGHGFGLHSGALAAKEMGGMLSVDSEGLGRGATFRLVLPMKRTKGTLCQTTTTDVCS